MALNSLRDFNRTTLDADLSNGPVGFRENELFFNCTFKNVRGATFKNCDLNGSKFLTDKLEDALGLTMTFDCHSVDNVEFSPLMFDLLLVLLLKSKGNNEKRKQLIDIIGKERLYELLTAMKTLE